MVLTLDVPRCPFWVHCRPHSPCHEPCGRTLTGKAKKANWPHTWWVFYFLLHKYFIVKTRSWLLMLCHIPLPWIANLPMQCPIWQKSNLQKRRRTNVQYHSEFCIFLFANYVIKISCL
jgi:hypothetical protein